VKKGRHTIFLQEGGKIQVHVPGAGSRKYFMAEKSGHTPLAFGGGQSLKNILRPVIGAVKYSSSLGGSGAGETGNQFRQQEDKGERGLWEKWMGKPGAEGLPGSRRGRGEEPLKKIERQYCSKVLRSPSRGGVEGVSAVPAKKLESPQYEKLRLLGRAANGTRTSAAKSREKPQRQETSTFEKKPAKLGVRFFGQKKRGGAPGAHLNRRDQFSKTEEILTKNVSLTHRGTLYA